MDITFNGPTSFPSKALDRALQIAMKAFSEGMHNGCDPSAWGLVVVATEGPAPSTAPLVLEAEPNGPGLFGGGPGFEVAVLPLSTIAHALTVPGAPDPTPLLAKHSGPLKFAVVLRDGTHVAALHANMPPDAVVSSIAAGVPAAPVASTDQGRSAYPGCRRAREIVKHLIESRTLTVDKPNSMCVVCQAFGGEGTEVRHTGVKSLSSGLIEVTGPDFTMYAGNVEAVSGKLAPSVVPFAAKVTAEGWIGLVCMDFHSNAHAEPIGRPLYMTKGGSA